MKDTTNTKKPGSGWLNIVIDYGPLLLFFLTYRYFAPEEPEPIAEVGAVIRGTMVFMAASLVALGVSKWRMRAQFRRCCGFRPC